MSEKEYQTLKKKSAAAGLSANAWLMNQLESNRPTVYREPETSEVLHFLDDVGHEVNAVAREFNCGYGNLVYWHEGIWTSPMRCAIICREAE